MPGVWHCTDFKWAPLIYGFNKKNDAKKHCLKNRKKPLRIHVQVLIYSCCFLEEREERRGKRERLKKREEGGGQRERRPRYWYVHVAQKNRVVLHVFDLGEPIILHNYMKNFLQCFLTHKYSKQIGTCTVSGQYTANPPVGQATGMRTASPNREMVYTPSGHVHVWEVSTVQKLVSTVFCRAFWKQKCCDNMTCEQH